MREDEAKTKWCPMVRFDTAGCNSDNQTQNIHNPGYCCIGSDCMMWKFETKYAPGKKPEQSDNGHCGLTK